MGSYEIKDKVFIVTGGAGGIGAGFTRAIVEEAKHVAILDLDGNAGVALQNELNAKYGPNKVKFYKVDVTNENQVDEAFDDVIKKNGNVDALMNFAGLMNDSPKVFMKSIQVNVGATVYLTMKFYEHTRKDHGGRGGTVVNIASIAALTNISCTPIYCGTKSAVLQFSTSLGDIKTYTRTGVRIITMCFGAVDTKLLSDEKLHMWDATFDQELGDFIQNILYKQKEESAVLGTVEAFKRGGPGSTWVVVKDQPAVDYTAEVKKAYDIMGAIVA